MYYLTPCIEVLFLSYSCQYTTAYHDFTQNVLHRPQQHPHPYGAVQIHLVYYLPHMSKREGVTRQYSSDCWDMRGQVFTKTVNLAINYHRFDLVVNYSEVLACSDLLGADKMYMNKISSHYCLVPRPVRIGDRITYSDRPIPIDVVRKINIGVWQVSFSPLYGL